MSNFNINQNFELGLYDGVKAINKTAKDRERLEELKQQKLKKKKAEKDKAHPKKHNDDDKGELIDTFA